MVCSKFVENNFLFIYIHTHIISLPTGYFLFYMITFRRIIFFHYTKIINNPNQNILKLQNMDIFEMSVFKRKYNIISSELV